MKIKRTLLCFFVFIIALSTSGCDYSFKGDYPELYTVAINSILGINGSSPGEYVAFQPYVEAWEEDDYGRQTFFYCERSVYFLVVSQMTDEKYVYFYSDYNFIFIDVSDSYDEGIFGYTSVEEPKSLFSDDSIEWLKEQNDWNEPIDIDKCQKAQITRKKIEPKIWSKNKKKKEAFEVLCQKVAEENGCKGKDNVFRYSSYCTSDNYGRALFYAWGIHRDVNGEGISPNSELMYFDLAIIFYPDGTYNDDSVMELTNLYDYQDELKAFKERNNWNQLI